MKIVIGVTGASGAALAAETLRQLREAGAETHLVMTGGAHITIAHELGPDAAAAMREAASFAYEARELGAPIASGSFGADAMAVVPCSMRSLAAIAHGFGDNLLTRAADVMLKERRRLVLVPREAPLHEGPPQVHARARADGRHRRASRAAFLYQAALGRGYRARNRRTGAGVARAGAGRGDDALAGRRRAPATMAIDPNLIFAKREALSKLARLRQCRLCPFWIIFGEASVGN